VFLARIQVPATAGATGNPPTWNLTGLGSASIDNTSRLFLIRCRAVALERPRFRHGVVTRGDDDDPGEQQTDDKPAVGPGRHREDSSAIVPGSRRTRPLWFDGRFLARTTWSAIRTISCVARRFRPRRGFGVVHGLMVRRVASSASRRMRSRS